ncbi:hypothetical protein B4U80_14231 [Leptotrombidium deliense]|uniref:RING-type domain-containing protein n=1 Tax=Leptotrombidium deliense TaxID=299467 RepID=A0A443RZR3_9ACAR|nr:hypothetical protein B4U80_14231 [Leptotrombidium deliense]
MNCDLCSRILCCYLIGEAGANIGRKVIANENGISKETFLVEAKHVLEPVMLTCGHAFHFHCIAEWNKNSQECPIFIALMPKITSQFLSLETLTHLCVNVAKMKLQEIKHLFVMFRATPSTITTLIASGRSIFGMVHTARTVMNISHACNW